MADKATEQGELTDRERIRKMINGLLEDFSERELISLLHRFSSTLYAARRVGVNKGIETYGKILAEREEKLREEG